MNPTSAANARARAPLPEQVDHAVVGAGLGGLVTAAYLARAGRRVAVFDSHYVAGGCATMFTRRGEGGRYHFDVGLHYIGDCADGGIIPAILRDFGLDLKFRPMDPEGFDTLVFPDFRFKIPASVDLYRERLVAMFPREKRGIDTYVRLLREVDQLTRRLEKTAGRPTWALLWHLLTSGRLAAKYKGRTIGEFLSAHTRDPKLRAVILGQSGDYGLPPSKVSALLHVGLANHYFRGAYYPVGGGQAIADALAAYIEAHGGSVHLRTPVEQILVRDGRATGVRVAPRNGPAVEIPAALGVVSNADLKRTILELLDPAVVPGPLAERVRGLEMAAAIFMTFLGVRGDLRARGMSDTNYWSFDGYDFEEFYATAAVASPETIRGSYITSASLKDPDTPTHAPAGMSTVEIMALVPGDLRPWAVEPSEVDRWQYKKSAAYLERKQRIEDSLVARFDRLFPGVAADIVYRESATPVTHARFTRATGGTGYGIAATPGQFLQNRPGYRGPVAGLYLCGASTRAGHGVLGAMMSGQAASKRVLGDSVGG